MALAVGIRELRENLRAYLGRVKEGERIVVTERGVPIANIDRAGDARVLDDMVKAGLATRPSRPKTPIDPKKLVPVRGTVTDILLEQRGESS